MLHNTGAKTIHESFITKRLHCCLLLVSKRLRLCCVWRALLSVALVVKCMLCHAARQARHISSRIFPVPKCMSYRACRDGSIGIWVYPAAWHLCFKHGHCSYNDSKSITQSACTSTVNVDGSNMCNRKRKIEKRNHCQNTGKAAIKIKCLFCCVKKPKDPDWHFINKATPTHRQICCQQQTTRGHHLTQTMIQLIVFNVKYTICAAGNLSLWHLVLSNLRSI